MVTNSGRFIVPKSIHRLLAHAPDLIRLNGSFGIGIYSEEGVEVLHIIVRRDREMLARKTIVRDNLTDVFHHM